MIELCSYTILVRMSFLRKIKTKNGILAIENEMRIELVSDVFGPHRINVFGML